MLFYGSLHGYCTGSLFNFKNIADTFEYKTLSADIQRIMKHNFIIILDEGIGRDDGRRGGASFVVRKQTSTLILI